MEVICLEDQAFYTLIETVVKRLKEAKGIKEGYVSIKSTEEALLPNGMMWPNRS